MNTKRKALMIGGGSIALVTIGFALLRSMSGDAPAGDAPRAVAAPAAAGRPGAGGAARSARQFQPGTRYVYEIESSRALSLYSDRGPGQPRALALAGRLSISVVSPTEDGYLLRLALDELRPGGAGGSGGAGRPGTADRLTGAFYAVALRQRQARVVSVRARARGYGARDPEGARERAPARRARSRRRRVAHH